MDANTEARPRRRVAAAIIGSALLGLTLGGCIYTAETERVVTAHPPVISALGSRTVAPSEGRWRLHGDGSAIAPYYWAWVSAGPAPVPAPPASRAP